MAEGLRKITKCPISNSDANKYSRCNSIINPSLKEKYSQIIMKSINTDEISQKVVQNIHWRKNPLCTYPHKPNPPFICFQLLSQNNRRIYTKNIFISFTPILYIISTMIKYPSKSATLFLLTLFVLTLSQVPFEDEVTQYFQGYPYKIYSGNLIISYFPQTSYVHYVYYQSQRDHQKDPLFLWMTGGPGCSSMATMMHENGPLRIEPGSSGVGTNPDAWNQRANLLFFELPLGVGYSQARDSNQTTIDDDIVSGVGLRALNIFFNKFPGLKKNDFYMGGSGYASNYVTKLGIRIIEQNEAGIDYYDKILFKGVLYGNPCMYPNQCYASGSERQSKYHYDFLYSRGFYPKSAYYQYLSKCAIQISPYDCYLERQKMDKNFNATNTSAYNIYSKCYKSSNQDSINTGCEDESGVLNFFNSQEFKTKWNINTENNKTWEVCSLQIWNEYKSENGSYHLLPQLLKKNIRMWVYSGDMDSTIPTIGTETWLRQFREEHLIPIKRNWREWWVPGKHKYEDQVGGFIWELEGLTFVTVKGAGFKAAQDQPVAMSQVFNGFLQGESLPYKS